MLYRKIAAYIEDYLKSEEEKILILKGARQIGKSFIVSEVAKRIYKNVITINFVEDDEGDKVFKNVHKTEDFYLNISMIASDRMGTREDTLVFLDEIQHYPQYMTLLKFFKAEKRFRFIASGSLLGVALNSATSIPVGSVIIKDMYQLDFEEFLIANNVGATFIADMRKRFDAMDALSEENHQYIMNMFRRYLLVGGLPDAVNEYLRSHNIAKVREVQDSIRTLYRADAIKYEEESSKKLMVQKIYDMIPSQMESVKKRIVFKDIRNKKGDRYDNYRDEFEYLISSGISLSANAITNPRYPLTESVQKNLLKLYLNDVGLLTGQLYHNNLRPVLNDETSINLGSVYETAVAQELKAHGHILFYYDNKDKGEVDFLIDDYDNLMPLPVEVKSGKDYKTHNALNRFLSTPDYHVKRAFVLSNTRNIQIEDKKIYMPVYYSMFLDVKGNYSEEDLIF